METETVVVPVRNRPISLGDLLGYIDGRGATMTDDNLLDEALADLGLTQQSELMVVPDKLFCFVLTCHTRIRHCGVYTSRRKAEEAFVKVVSNNDVFEEVAANVNGDHVHDYPLTLDAVEGADFWDVSIEPIDSIE